MMKKTTLHYLFWLSVFAAPVYAADLQIKKDIVFQNGDRVYVQGGKVAQKQTDLAADKGYCQIHNASITQQSIPAGAVLAVSGMMSEFEAKKITMTLQQGDGSGVTFLCEMPELPSMEKLSAIVLKDIFEDADWKQRYNQMAANEQAEAMKIFMARAANQLLDEEFALIMMGIAELKF
jgi:hypothetical protein